MSKPINELKVEPSLPWFKYPMVWMIIVLPLIVVLASIYTIRLAFQNAPEVIPKPTEKVTMLQLDVKSNIHGERIS